MQVVTMLLATSPPELTLNHPELGDFVIDRTRTGLADLNGFYLSLYAGPNARSTGVAVRLDLEREAGHPGRGPVSTIRLRDDD
jgi:hypothetical protein